MQLSARGARWNRNDGGRMQPTWCAKGFGNSAERRREKAPDSQRELKGRYKGDAVDASSSKAVERAVKLVERRSPPINPNEASRGRVNFVRVKDWGSGRAEDVGELQVKGDSQAYVAGAPFYEMLARRLEVLQADGALAVAQARGAAPLPPFERWAFAETHYVQHLADLLCVHAALEQTIVCVQEALQSASGGGRSASLLRAVALFGDEHGLARSTQIAADLAHMVVDQPGVLADATPDPLPNAAAFARYIRLLGEQCTRAESTSELGAAVARLLANAYVVQLTLLTSGTRVGAAATEKLGLFDRDAVRTYASYPGLASRPLAAFVAAVNGAGEALAEAEREAWMAELPWAMQKASLLLEALAKES